MKEFKNFWINITKDKVFLDNASKLAKKKQDKSEEWYNSYLFTKDNCFSDIDELYFDEEDNVISITGVIKSHFSKKRENMGKIFISMEIPMNDDILAKIVKFGFERMKNYEKVFEIIEVIKK